MKPNTIQPNGYKQAKEVNPNMEYWLSNDNRPSYFRKISSSYGKDLYYTELINSKLKEGIIFIKK